MTSLPNRFVLLGAVVISSLFSKAVGADAVVVSLRFLYRNVRDKALPFELEIGVAAAKPLSFAATGDMWRKLDVIVQLQAGANVARLRGLGDGWEDIELESLELVVH